MLNQKVVENAHEDSIWTTCWLDDSIVTGSVDETVRVWSVEGERLLNLEGHNWGVVSVAYSTSTKVLASSSLDSHIRLWDSKGKLKKND